MRTQAVKLTVITDTSGTVLATRPTITPEPSLGMVPYVRLVAGPNQELHDVEVELPQHVFESWNVEELHEIVQSKIRKIRSA
jgi:hypothetical protein